MKLRRMVFSVAAIACIDCIPNVCRAQPAPPPPPTEAGVVPARVGFQLALRTGYMVPFGQATGTPGDSMSNTFSGEVPILVDVGWKPLPMLFIGAYTGIGFGGAAGTSGQLCDQLQVTCLTVSFRVGIEAQYHFAPDSWMNPWVGYGIGIESTAFSSSNSANSYSVAATGWEFGHFMAGLDFRLSRLIGVGPMVDFSVGQYSTLSINVNGQQSSSSIPNQALHEWLLIGARLVFFP